MSRGRGSRKPTGAVLWSGPSRNNNAPIALVATGTDPSQPSLNKKTGPIIQGHVLPVLMSPYASVLSGADVAVCGDCGFRPANNPEPKAKKSKGKAGVCYVRTMDGPGAVYRSLTAGKYPERRIVELDPSIMFRHGAWGDPAFTPNRVTLAIQKFFRRTVGYTHQWLKRPALRGALMASVNSRAEAIEARKRGWRWFRLLSEGEDLLPGEILCPHYTHGTQCRDCGICDGADGKCPMSVAVPAHGGGRKLFERLFPND